MGLLALILATVPAWGTDYMVLLCLFFCLYLGMSQAWNLLIGYSGLLSLGQQSFIGLGGYTVAVMSFYYGVNIWVGVFLGGLFSVLLALFMSLFIFRMRGIFLGIGTWVFAEALLIWFSNWKYVKYGMGMCINPPNPP
ncbi:MAG: branched-chain amino acid ABC transporter permease, partial [Deltaproteobacteria bacterium]|nr:branched-chain amino acid ABC transporter permease [Deltaproteobacteria bacterium]